jgi:hypothetical protein
MADRGHHLGGRNHETMADVKSNIKFRIHVAPVWRDKSDFLIHARAEQRNSEVYVEQLWARQLGDNRFEVCCIPFFVYDLALGDEVETDQENDLAHMLQRVVKPSGHYTFRAWFARSPDPKIRQKVATEVERVGCLCEYYSADLLAIDAPTDAKATMIAAYLMSEEQLGNLVYETGRSR